MKAATTCIRVMFSFAKIRTYCHLFNLLQQLNIRDAATFVEAENVIRKSLVNERAKYTRTDSTTTLFAK